MPKPENQATYDKLAAELKTVKSEISSLTTVKTNLGTYLSNINKSYTSFTQTKTSVLSKPLTKTIVVSEDCEGNCADGLKSNYELALTLIEQREKTIGDLKTGTSNQIKKIDAGITNLDNIKNKIISTMNKL